jgi:UPF0716 protein FxsA
MRPLLVLLFIVVPLVELAIVLQVRAAIGLDWTLLLLLIVSVVGALLVKREGVRAWSRFRDATQEGRLPAVEVTDGALVLLGGALMVTPGFLTDLVGLLLVAPPSRGVVNRILRARVRSAFGLGPPAPGRPRSRRAADEVVDVEVVSVERDEPEPPPSSRAPLEGQERDEG